MDNVIMLKTGSPAPESLDDWKAYIAAASQVEKQAGQSLIDAIIEKGKRIAEFHTAYKAKGQKWGKTWKEVCKNTLGMGATMCLQYMAIGKNQLGTSEQVLPKNIDALYNLCRVVRADRKAFDEAVASGEVNSKMTVAKTEMLAQRAERKSRSPSAAT